MSSKSLVFLGMVIGSTLGSYLPTFFGVDSFSFTTIITGAIGGILGIWLGFKLNN